VLPDSRKKEKGEKYKNWKTTVKSKKDEEMRVWRDALRAPSSVRQHYIRL
jgi:hypothetical protein